MREISRRGFLAQSCKGVSAVWLAAHWTDIRAAAQHAHHTAQTTAPAKFEFFTPEQAREIEAAAAQIIPSDDSVGAREAHVIYFIDRVLATIEADKQPLYKQGLALLGSRARRAGGARFSELDAAQQIAVLKKIEKTPFFQLLRGHTIAGFLANPEYGGNYNQAGWRLIGFEDQGTFAPPFGFYDRDYKPEQ
ncbi:MAG TPA: gluconate 2-dehydrogenase subunit 3 family protein [Blastocatellia bacterium]|nr:gluconate 2-dehydrogenase subunit 3 family protein [Blastocatellia bacterium]